MLGTRGGRVGATAGLFPLLPSGSHPRQLLDWDLLDWNEERLLGAISGRDDSDKGVVHSRPCSITTRVLL